MCLIRSTDHDILNRIRAVNGLAQPEGFDGYSPTGKPESEQFRWFQSRFTSIVLFQCGDLRLLTDIATLEQPATTTMLFNQHRIIDPMRGELSLLLIDRNLYDGGLTRSVAEFVTRVSERRTAESRRHKSTRESLHSEMNILENILFSADEAAKRTVAGRYFSVFIMYPDSDEENYFHMEWSVDPAKLRLAQISWPSI